MKRLLDQVLKVFGSSRQVDRLSFYIDQKEQVELQIAQLKVQLNAEADHSKRGILELTIRRQQKKWVAITRSIVMASASRGGDRYLTKQLQVLAQKQALLDQEIRFLRAQP